MPEALPVPPPSPRCPQGRLTARTYSQAQKRAHGHWYAHTNTIPPDRPRTNLRQPESAAPKRTRPADRPTPGQTNPAPPALTVKPHGRHQLIPSGGVGRAGPEAEKEAELGDTEVGVLGQPLFLQVLQRHGGGARGGSGRRRAPGRRRGPVTQPRRAETAASLPAPPPALQRPLSGRRCARAQREGVRMRRVEVARGGGCGSAHAQNGAEWACVVYRGCACSSAVLVRWRSAPAAGRAAVVLRAVRKSFSFPHFWVCHLSVRHEVNPWE